MGILEDRPLHISDVILLVAASAVGLGVIRLMTHSEDFPTGRLGMESLVIVFGLSLAFVWSVALLALHLKGPIPPWRRLTLRPGFAATFAVTIAALVFLFANAAQIIHAQGLPSETYFLTWRFLHPQDKAGTVAAVWLYMALGGRWRGERSWLDRAGRLIGFFWLAAFPALAVLSWIQE